MTPRDNEVWHGAYRAYLSFGKWRVSLGESSRYLMSGTQEQAVSFAEKMSRTHDAQGKYIVTEEDRKRVNRGQ